jgi:hypothetical protein
VAINIKIMENTFSFSRFILLVKRQWIENKKLFLMGIGVILGLDFLLYGITTSWRMAVLENSIQYSAFIVGFLICGPIFTSFIFKDFSSKNGKMSYLQLPATHFEKLLVGILYSFIVFPIILSIIYFCVDYFFVNYVNQNHMNLLKDWDVEYIKNWRPNIPFIDQITEKPMIFKQQILGTWLVIQAFTILGSITFGSMSIIKTAFSGLAIFLFGCLLFLISTKLFLQNNFEKMNVNQFIQRSNSIMLQTKPIVDKFLTISTICLLIIFPIILLISAYYKLKEKEA